MPSLRCLTRLTSAPRASLQAQTRGHSKVQRSPLDTRQYNGGGRAPSNAKSPCLQQQRKRRRQIKERGVQTCPRMPTAYATQWPTTRRRYCCIQLQATATQRRTRGPREEDGTAEREQQYGDSKQVYTLSPPKCEAQSSRRYERATGATQMQEQSGTKPSNGRIVQHSRQTQPERCYVHRVMRATGFSCYKYNGAPAVNVPTETQNS